MRPGCCKDFDAKNTSELNSKFLTQTRVNNEIGRKRKICQTVHDEGELGFTDDARFARSSMSKQNLFNDDFRDGNKND